MSKPLHAEQLFAQSAHGFPQPLQVNTWIIRQISP
jgi:hypothetical protein